MVNFRRQHLLNLCVMVALLTLNVVTGFLTTTHAINYASVFLGAKVVDFHNEAKGAHHLLSDGSDRYMSIPCAAQRKKFTIQLSREVEISLVTLTNTEYFSSSIKNFTLVGSRTYPCRPPECMWRVLASLQASHTREKQFFPIPKHPPVRFVRLLWVSHYGLEKQCILTSMEVYGIDVLENLASELSESAYADATEEIPTETDALLQQIVNQADTNTGATFIDGSNGGNGSNSPNASSLENVSSADGGFTQIPNHGGPFSIETFTLIGEHGEILHENAQLGTDGSMTFYESPLGAEQQSPSSLSLLGKLGFPNRAGPGPIAPASVVLQPIQGRLVARQRLPRNDSLSSVCILEDKEFDEDALFGPSATCQIPTGVPSSASRQGNPLLKPLAAHSILALPHYQRVIRSIVANITKLQQSLATLAATSLKSQETIKLQSEQLVMLERQSQAKIRDLERTTASLTHDLRVLGNQYDLSFSALDRKMTDMKQQFLVLLVLGMLLLLLLLAGFAYLPQRGNRLQRAESFSLHPGFSGNGGGRFGGTSIGSPGAVSDGTPFGLGSGSGFASTIGSGVGSADFSDQDEAGSQRINQSLEEDTGISSSAGKAVLLSTPESGTDQPGAASSENNTPVTHGGTGASPSHRRKMTTVRSSDEFFEHS